MGKHQECRAVESQNIEGGKTEEDVAHVHDAGISDRPVETLLGHGHISDVADISDQQQDQQRIEELMHCRWK